MIPYDAPTNLNVSVNNEDDIIITWTLDMGELAVPQFEIYIDKELVGTYEATYVESNFTLTVLHTDINHVLFADLTIVGLHSVEIRALGDDYYTVDSPLSAEFLFERKSIYDEAPTGVAVYDYFYH